MYRNTVRNKTETCKNKINSSRLDAASPKSSGQRVNPANLYGAKFLAAVHIAVDGRKKFGADLFC